MKWGFKVRERHLDHPGENPGLTAKDLIQGDEHLSFDENSDTDGESEGSGEEMEAEEMEDEDGEDASEEDKEEDSGL